MQRLAKIHGQRAFRAGGFVDPLNNVPKLQFETVDRLKTIA
jgi:hypothetical protein